MTEERVEELAIEACETWNTFPLMRAKELIRAVAAEAREEGRIEGIEEMRAGIECVEALIDNSEGVTGLHLNGDIAPWDELRTGGVYYEWLVEFDRAAEHLKEKVK